MRHTRSRTGLTLLTGCLLLAGCTPAPADNPASAAGAAIRSAAVPAGWVGATPPGLLPTTISASDAGLLVGGASADPERQPMLAVLRDGSWLTIPATATTAYGAMATMVHLDLSADQQLVAIGSVAGGAHLNPRWSAWIGSTAGVAEEPQTVETFGGPDAGGITGVVSGPDPMVVGTWSQSSGVIGVAFWRHSPVSTGGRTWLRQPSPPVLAGSAQQLATATATASSGAVDSGAAAVAIAGLLTSFRAGAVHQQAVVWTSGADPQSWNMLELDSSDQDSAATDIACSGGTCVAVGRLADRLAAWRIDVAAGSAIRIADLPDQQVDHYSGQPRVGVAGGTTVIAPGASGDPLLSSGGAGWTSGPVPPGEQREVGVTGGNVYLLLRSEQEQQVLYAKPVRS